MEDSNVNLGTGRMSVSVVPFRLGNRNSREDALEIFPKSNKLVVINVWFKLYLEITEGHPWRFRNSWTSIKTYIGADIQSDHILLSGKLKLKLKRITNKDIRRYDQRKLRDTSIQHTIVENALNEKLRYSRNTEIVGEGLATIQKQQLK